MYKEIENEGSKFGSDYLAALNFWGEFKDEPGNLEKVIEIIKYCERELGATTLAYVIKSGSYVAIRFEKKPSLSVVFVHVGFVDHRVEIPGSDWNTVHDIWRTDLPTGKKSVSGYKKSPEINHLTCRNAFSSIRQIFQGVQFVLRVISQGSNSKLRQSRTRFV